MTRDPELRTARTAGGDKSVCNFTVAVNRRNRGTNEQNDADFFSVAAWGKTGENCAKYLQKGKKVMVSGPVSVRTYQANDGTTKATLDVMAQDVEFLSPAGGRNETTTAAPADHSFTAVQTEELPF